MCHIIILFSFVGRPIAYVLRDVSINFLLYAHSAAALSLGTGLTRCYRFQGQYNDLRLSKCYDSSSSYSTVVSAVKNLDCSPFDA